MFDGGGRGRIEFASQHMPALRAATEAVAAAGRLAGRRIGVALTLEPKTACLVESIASLGAEVAVLAIASSTKPEVVEALAAAGVTVLAEPGAPPERAAALLDSLVDTQPEYLCDDNAVVVRYIHRARPGALAALRGVAEETTSGVRPLRVMEEQGVLEVPCVAVNDARTKVEFDNVYGTGQSVVTAVVDATGLRLGGLAVVVVGYGPVGRGIAAMARAMGCRVTVTEVDPVRALVAVHDGFAVAPLARAVRTAGLVVTATGIGHSLTGEHLELLPDGAVVAVGGAGQPEVDPTLDGEIAWGEEVLPGVRELHTGRGTTILLVADGHCANTTAGEGNPIEIMDLSLALQLRALDHLAANDLPPGVHLLPRHVEDEVARSQLAAAGIDLDLPSEAQRRAAGTW